ncbi:MAG: TlpA family protein disulfide reductase [Proteobacteria bacterium]|nr:TlpA family protein disulfide reductase [Pseudomonadota bacterium]
MRVPMDASFKRFGKLILILALAAAGGCSSTPGDNAPQVRFATLAGQSFTTADLRGKVVLVNFWATSCEVCVREMPMMAETYRKFAPRGYDMVAVAMSYDHPNLVADYAQKHALPFRVSLDFDGAIAKQWGNVQATPTTFVVDRRGRIVKQYVGEPSVAELHAVLEKALAEPA